MLALVGEGGVARDHEQPAKARQLGDQLLDHAVGEVVVPGLVAHSRKAAPRWTAARAGAPRAGRGARPAHAARIEDILGASGDVATEHRLAAGMHAPGAAPFGMLRTACSPRSSKAAPRRPRTATRTDSDTTMPPGSAMACSRGRC